MIWNISEKSLYGVGDYVYTVDAIKDKGIEDFDIDYIYIEYHYKKLSDNVMVVLSNELNKFEILLDKGAGVYLSLGVGPFTDNYKKEFDF